MQTPPVCVPVAAKAPAAAAAARHRRLRPQHCAARRLHLMHRVGIDGPRPDCRLDHLPKWLAHLAVVPGPVGLGAPHTAVPAQVVATQTARVRPESHARTQFVIRTRLCPGSERRATSVCQVWGLEEQAGGRCMSGPLVEHAATSNSMVGGEAAGRQAGRQEGRQAGRQEASRQPWLLLQCNISNGPSQRAKRTTHGGSRWRRSCPCRRHS